MEAEIVLNLLDSCWYDLEIFNKSKPRKINQIPEIPTSDLNIPNLPTIYTNSPPFERMSSSSSKLSDSSFSSASPNSVLQSPKLQTIFSGKEIRYFGEEESEKSAQEQQQKQEQQQQQQQQQVSSSSSPSSSSSSAAAGVVDAGNNLKGNIVISRRRKKRLSKSLSDLEFEELKGFMDLGFVFSEEDKDSTLASIIPGLQRLGINNNNNHNVVKNEEVINVIVVDKNGSKSGVVSRPYLSESWELLEKKKKMKETSSSSSFTSVLNWKVPASSDQIDMKGYLKSWAHNVASTVK